MAVEAATPGPLGARHDDLWGGRWGAYTAPAMGWRLASLLLLGVTAVWGWTFVAVQDAVTAWDVPGFLALRFAIAAAVAATLWARRLDRRSLRAGSGIGLLLATGYLLQTFGLRLTTATSAGLITGLFVVVGPLAARALYRTPLPPIALVAVGVSLLGMTMLTGRLPASLATGDLLILGCALAFGVHIAVLSRHAPRHDPLALGTAQMVCCAVVFLVLWPLTGSFELPPAGVWPALVVTGAIASALAYAVQTAAQRHLSAVQTSLVLACEPLFAGVFGYLLARDRLTATQLTGGALIVAALLLVELVPRLGEGRGPSPGK